MPSLSRDKRKPVRLSESLQRNVALYALAAGAAGVQLLALGQASEAEVVYTNAHSLIGRNRALSFDLNHDGVNDFTIMNLYGRASTYTGCRLQIRPDHAGGVAYSVQNSWGDLATLFHRGETIGAGRRFDPNDALMALAFDISGLYGGTGYWTNVKNGYAGLAFKIDGAIHYGWVRLNVKTNGFRLQAMVSGYAYETQPNTPIIAGDTGGSVDEAADEEEKTQPRPTSGVSQKNLVPSAAALGALSLGAPGLAIWRRNDV
jgi:hypothetical protein